MDKQIKEYLDAELYCIEDCLYHLSTMSWGIKAGECYKVRIENSGVRFLAKMEPEENLEDVYFYSELVPISSVAKNCVINQSFITEKYLN